MAFIHDGECIFFNEYCHDWKFIDVISYILDAETDTEHIIEKWEHTPTNSTHMRNMSITHYKKDVIHRRQIKPFGRMKNGDSSKHTTLGEDVFIEWNPAIFFYNDKLTNYCKRMINKPSTIREPIILNKEINQSQPSMIDDEIDISLVNQVNKLYRPDTNMHINFMNQPEHRSPINPLKATWGKHKSDEELAESEKSGAYIPRHQRTGITEATVKITELGDTSDITPGDIASFLRKYNIVEFGKITIPRDRETGINRDITYINFDTVIDANLAIESLNNQRARFGYSCVKACLAY